MMETEIILETEDLIKILEKHLGFKVLKIMNRSDIFSHEPRLTVVYKEKVR